MNKARGADCAHCPLRTRPFVPSTINPGASLILVGEAPGAQEVYEGRPFCGPSGKVLDFALHHIGLDPASVSRTNAVACRPVGNADPPPEALQACSGRLRAALAAAGAAQVVALGKHATAALDALYGVEDARPITRRAGDARQLTGGVRYTATLHPAYVLRSDEAMPKFLRDLEHAVRPRPAFDMARVQIVTMTEANADAVLAYLNRWPDGSPLAFDTETEDLQWYATRQREAAKLLCLVLNFEDYRSVIIPAAMLDNATIRQAVQHTLDRSWVIAHNGKFDQDVAYARLGWDVTISDDTMLMHYAAYEIGAHGLKDLATDYLGVPDYEGELIDAWFAAYKIAPGRRNYGLLPPERLYRYAGIDGCVTLQLWRVFDAELRAKGLYERPYRLVLMDALAYAIPKIEQNGIGIDTAQLEAFGVALQAEQDQLIADMRIELAKHIADPGGLFTARAAKAGSTGRTVHYSEFSPGSNFQVSAVLYDVLGLKLTKHLLKETKTNTGKEALEALPDHPFVQLLRRYRKSTKAYDMYVTSLCARATPAGLLHIDFRITGTEIGRLSASNGDHGIPRPTNFYGSAVRSAFRAVPSDDPDEDEVLIIGDYSQAELRAFAVLGNVPFLLDKYRNGEDVHTETAKMLDRLGAPLFDGFADAFEATHNGTDLYLADHISGEPISAKAFVKDRRTFAKNINFGNIYQGGATGIAGMIGGVLPVPVVQQVLDVYARLMPEAKQYARDQYALLLRQGFVTTRFNRHRRFYVLSDANKDEARKAVVHMVVASTAADLNNIAAARLVRAGVRVCHLVHDSIIARAKRHEAADVARLMYDTMTGVGNEYMPEVPWVVDIDQEKDGSYPTRWADVPSEELAQRSASARAEELRARLTAALAARAEAGQPLAKSLQMLGA